MVDAMRCMVDCMGDITERLDSLEQSTCALKSPVLSSPPKVQVEPIATLVTSTPLVSTVTRTINPINAQTNNVPNSNPFSSQVVEQTPTVTVKPRDVKILQLEELHNLSSNTKLQILDIFVNISCI